jgi:lysophospholipase L1-like esterase
MIDYNYSPMKIEAISKNDWREFHSFKDDNFEYDPYLIWRPRKNYSVFNSQGFRGEELGVKKDNEFRIFAIGDSNTLGWSGEKNAPNWPMYLEELLRESNDRFTVINAGVWGYSSFQGLRRFKEILRFQPDMVLISFVSNDAQKVAFSDAEYLHRGKELAFYNILLKFRLGKLMIAFFDKFKSLKKDYNKEEDFLVPRVSLEQYKNNLKEIIRISKENNIQPVLLTRPYIGDPPNEFYFSNFAPAYNRSTIQIAEQKDVPTVDVYTYFKNKQDHFMDDSHFTRLGHKIAAALIYDKISSSLPLTSKKITLNDYLERLNNHFNNTKKLIPKEVDSNVRNFNNAFIFTKGNGKIKNIQYDKQTQDNFLVINSFGFNPYKDDMEKLKLRIITNGIELKYSHKDKNSYYFVLDKNVMQINEIQINSSTFIRN